MQIRKASHRPAVNEPVRRPHPDVRPELFLFLMLGAGSHMFDVTALAQESLGIDATSDRTREEFVALIRQLLERGLLRPLEGGAPSPPAGRGR